VIADGEVFCTKVLSRPMKIAIASGKGGTGKTTVATNLANVAAREGRTAAYLDCHAEKPMSKATGYG